MPSSDADKTLPNTQDIGADTPCVQLHTPQLHWSVPLVVAGQAHRQRAVHILRIRWQGAAGLGEACGWPGFGADPAVVASQASPAEQAARKLAAAVSTAWAQACTASRYTAPRYTAQPHTSQQRAVPQHHTLQPALRALRCVQQQVNRLSLCAPWQHAIVWAWLDVLAQLGGVHAGQLLAAYIAQADNNPDSQDRSQTLLPTPTWQQPWSLPASRLAANAAVAKRWAQQGCRAFKIKLGRAQLTDDLAHATAVRSAIGDQASLRADANGVWTLPQAVQALRALAAVRLDFTEEPVDHAAWPTPQAYAQALRQLRLQTGQRLAADESLTAWPQLLDTALCADALDVAVLKPMFLGGPIQALQLARTAQQNGLSVVFTHALGSAVERSAAFITAWVASQNLSTQPPGMGDPGFVDDLAQPLRYTAADVLYTCAGPSYSGITDDSVLSATPA